MQFIIVADKKLAPFGRKLAHALSNQKTHAASFWSVERYKDNEFTINAKQPVIFLGDHELTQSYIEFLPKRFQRFGVRCHHEGSKAVLVVDPPSVEDLLDFEGLVAALGKFVKTVDERRRLLEADAVRRRTEEGAITSAVGGLIYLALRYFESNLSKHVGLGATYFLLDSTAKRQRKYRELQYDYLLARFLLEEFEAYVTGIEAL